MTKFFLNSGLNLTCRTCLLSPNLLRSLYAEEEETGIPYSYMLESCASIQIHKDDNLPKQVCLLCSDAIKACYTFKELCRSSERNLKLMYMNSENNNPCVNLDINSNQMELEDSKLCLSSNSSCNKIENEGAIKLECEVEDTQIKIKLEKSDGEVLTESNPLEEVWLNSACNFNEMLAEVKPEIIEDENVNVGIEDVCEKFICETCNKTLSSKQNLRRHIRTHNKEKPFRCTSCDKTFARSSDCLNHELVHEGVKRFKCDVCDKAFISSPSLRRHVLKQHAREKSHVCKICSKTFTFLSGLKLHIRTHAGEKPYVCEICHRGFPHSGSLWDHMRMHSGEKPHQCPECDMGFIGKSHLTRHIKLIHSFKCKFCYQVFEHKYHLEDHLSVCRETFVDVISNQ